MRYNSKAWESLATKEELQEVLKTISTELSRRQNMNATAYTVNDKPVDIKSLELDGLDPRDRPDFADAFFSSGEFMDGTPMTEEELEKFNNENGELINNMANEEMMDF